MVFKQTRPQRARNAPERRHGRLQLIVILALVAGAAIGCPLVKIFLDALTRIVAKI